MAIIWLIESASLPKPQSIVDTLIGNYPIRKFSSISSLNKLAKPSNRNENIIIIINAQSHVTQQDEELLNYSWGGYPKLYIGCAKPSKDEMINNYCLSKVESPFQLIRGVEAIKNDYYLGNSPDKLIYKDLIFEAKNDLLKITSSDESFGLTRNESKILSILLAKPMTPIKREDISAGAWNGIKLSTRNIDTHISRLRKKLAHSDVTIKSIYRQGYILT